MREKEWCNKFQNRIAIAKPRKRDDSLLVTKINSNETNYCNFVLLIPGSFLIVYSLIIQILFLVLSSYSSTLFVVFSPNIFNQDVFI